MEKKLSATANMKEISYRRKISLILDDLQQFQQKNVDELLNISA